MSKLVTNDNLKAYHAELAEHIKLLQRNTAYVLDDIVNYDGITLKCTTAGTTNTIKPNISSLSVGSTYTDGTCVWTRVDLDKRGIDYYVSSKDYEVDDQVVYNNNIYRCITAHTSTPTFDNAKWAEISAGSSSSGGISIWQANTAYNVNDVVIDSNLIWQCATAHTSSTTFDESKWVCISGGEISNGLEIVDLWSGSYSTSNNSSDYTSFSYTQNISDSIANYDYLVITTQCNTSNVNNNIFNTSDAINHDDLRCSIFANNSFNSALSIIFVDNTTFGISWSASVGLGLPSVVKIQGIRKAKPIVSSGMKYETLWEGEAGNISGAGSGTITLSEPVSKYKKIGLYLDCYGTRPLYREIIVDQYLKFLSDSVTNSTMSFCWGYGSSDDNFDITIASTTSQIDFMYNKIKVTKVIGISEGVVVPTGVQAARVELWSGIKLGNDSSLQILSDSIQNYDTLEVVTAACSSYGENLNSYTTQYIDVNTVIQNLTKYFRLSTIYNTSNYYTMEFKFPDMNYLNIAYYYVSGWSMCCITKITGIKYIQPDSYSTTEKLIGTWIDGKPLYRKVFENVSNGLNLGLPSSQFSVKRIYGGSVAGDNSVFPLPNETNNIAILSSGYFDTNRSGYIDWIAVEYTKN